MIRKDRLIDRFYDFKINSLFTPALTFNPATEAGPVGSTA